MTKSIVRLCTLGCILATLTACSPNPGIGGTDLYAATTPNTYTEARAMYLGDAGKQFKSDGTKLEPAEPVGRVNNADIETSTLRQLLFSYQVNKNLDAELTERYELVRERIRKGEKVDPRFTVFDSYVQHNQPLSVIVSKVVAPPYSGTRDIAVILDVITKEEQKVQPLVVFYQRDVPGDTALNFDNLLVYYDQKWDSKLPPYFRLRMLDVETEDNKATMALLSKVENFVSSFGPLLPHPALPLFQIGVEAGKQIVGNQYNTVLMDYTVQFYAAADRAAAGGADLGYLKTGHWIVVGKNSQMSPEFWARGLYFDQRTQRVYGARTDREPDPQGTELEPLQIGMPTVLMTVTTAESVVPTIVLDRSTELTALLTANPNSQDFDALESKLKTLVSGVQTYVVARRVQREQNADAMNAVKELLTKHSEAKKKVATEPDRAKDILNDGDVNSLLLTVQRATGQSFGSVDDFLLWYGTNSPGSFQYDPELKRTIWMKK